MNLVFVEGLPRAFFQGTEKLINSLNFKVVHQSLRYLEPELWTDALLADVEVKYRNFLWLKWTYRKIPIIPTKVVDKFWHAHILDTEAYCHDCELVFGRYLHHDPMFGVGSPEASERLRVAFDKTCELFQRHFGTDFRLHSEASFCSSGCAACSSSCK